MLELEDNTADALTHLQLEAFYVDLNTNTGNIEAQNPIDMQDQRIKGVAEPIHHKDAATKFYIDNFMTQKADKTELSQKADKTDLANYLKRDGTVSVTGDFDFGDNKITNVGNGSQSTDAVNKGYIDTALAAKPNINQIILRDGSQDMSANLNMSLNKIINCGQPTGNRDVTNKAYVDFEVGKKPDINQVVLRDGSNTILNDLDMTQKKIINCGPPSGQFDVTRKSYVDNQFSRCLRLDGSNKMTSNLDMNNQQIKNVKDATHNQDTVTLKQVNNAISTVSTNSEKYTDKKIAESHISIHDNRKNVLKYAMDLGEFTEDFGLQGTNLITNFDSPHKTNKKAFLIDVEKSGDISKFSCGFDFNLFKMIRDDFSNQYTVCVEIYFDKSGRDDTEFDSANITFQRQNMLIRKAHTIKVDSDYKYYRSVLNLAPDGSSPTIQRRLYINFDATYNNLSPSTLPLHVLIYGIKDEFRNDIDMTIYDYEKAYEVANNQFQMHVPINMNSNRIRGLLFPEKNTDAVNKSYLFDRTLSVYVWGETTQAISNAECKFTLMQRLVIGFTQIYILSITLVAERIYPVSSNHKLTIESDATAIFNLNFSSKRTIIVNINRLFTNVTKLKITFSGTGDARKFYHIIEHKTFSR